MNTDAEMILLEQKANDAAAIAGTRGYDLPPEYSTARAIASEAAKARNTPPPATPYPTKPSAVAKWIADTAIARAEWRDTQAVASELADVANRNALRSAFDAAPGYVDLIVAEFADHAADFRRLAAIAPHTTTGHETTEARELNAELLRAVTTLTADASHRSRLALLCDEGPDIGKDVSWLLMDPTGTTSIAAVHAALAKFGGQLPTTIDDWLLIQTVGLDMAPRGHVAARKQRFAMAVVASGNAPDGGMQDKTLDEALRLATKAA